jgi:membrane-bound ClpP family serine protease
MKRSIIYLLVLGVACTFLGFWTGQLAAQNSEPEVFLARIEGGIGSQVAAYVERVISEADDAGAGAVVLELNTPGGSLDATQEIVKTESNAEDVAVVTYVAPRGAQATSAGTFIVMGSDVAAMAPQTRLGGAHPVLAGGGDIIGALGEKATNDAVALMTGLASAHGRNEEWAESSVRESVSVDAEEALELGVVEHVEPDLEAVLEAVDGERVEPKDITLQTSGATIIEKPMAFTERIGFFDYVLWILVLLAVLFLLAVGFTYRRMRRWRVSTGREGMVGEIGVVRQPVVGGMGGLVFVHGERWRAVPEKAGNEPIKDGTEVEILGFRRGAVVVRAVEHQDSADSS